MVRFRKISPLPYKAKSIGNLNKKIGSWNLGNWYAFRYGDEFSTPLVKDDGRGNLEKAKEFLLRSIMKRESKSEGDQDILSLLKKERDFIDYIL